MIQGVLLAAGAGRRYGGEKLLQARWQGRPIVEHSLQHLLAAVPDTVAVVADETDDLARLLRRCGVDTVRNPEPGRGMGSSIAAAVAARPDADGWIIALADMPWIRVDSIARVVQALREGAAIAAPFHQGRRGHPVGFSAALQAQLQVLDGAEGARQLLQGAAGLTRVDVADPGVVLDVDRPSDLERAPGGFDRGQ